MSPCALPGVVTMQGTLPKKHARAPSGGFPSDSHAPGGAVVRGGDGMARVGRERNVDDPAAVPSEHGCAAPGRGVPHARAEVLARRHRAPPVRRQRHRPHACARRVFRHGTKPLSITLRAREEVLAPPHRAPPVQRATAHTPARGVCIGFQARAPRSPAEHPTRACKGVPATHHRAPPDRHQCQSLHACARASMCSSLLEAP